MHKSDTIDAQQLWDNFKKDPSCKSDLVMHYLCLVKSIVVRILPTYNGYVEYDDMISCGIIGLMDAIEKYDDSKNISFECYSKQRIHGEIIDNLRKMDWASVSLRARIKSMNEICSNLSMKLDREPTTKEISIEMNLPIEKVEKLKESVHMFNILHFESMASNNNNGSITDVIQDANTEDISNVLEKEEYRKYLAKAIDSLGENESMTIKLYYYNELKFKEIAKILEVSDSRISQIHSNALKKLRKYISTYN